MARRILTKPDRAFLKSLRLYKYLQDRFEEPVYCGQVFSKGLDLLRAHCGQGKEPADEAVVRLLAAVLSEDPVINAKLTGMEGKYQVLNDEDAWDRIYHSAAALLFEHCEA